MNQRQILCINGMNVNFSLVGNAPHFAYEPIDILTLTHIIDQMIHGAGDHCILKPLILHISSLHVSDHAGLVYVWCKPGVMNL